MGWDYGHMGGWGWAGMGVGFVLFWGLVAAGVVYVVRSGRRDTLPSGPSASTPRDILDARLARGEISVADYADSMAALDGPAAAK